MLVSDGSSKFVHVRKLVLNTSSQKFELPYLLVLLSFTLHLFRIPCSSTRGNISSEMVCKSTYKYDRVNKCTAKYFTDHGWTNLVQETVEIYFFVRDMSSSCVKHKLDAWCMAIDLFFLLLEMIDSDKLKSKREIIMEKRMHDTCNKKKKNLLEDLYISAILLRVF